MFPAPFIEEAVFAALYILAFFVKNNVSIGAWVYLWAFYLIPLVYICFCASTVLSSWLQLGSIVWSQEGWFLQLHSSFSRLLWLFRVFCVSIWIAKSFVLVLWKMLLVICYGLHWICRWCLVVVFTILILPIQEHGLSLHLCWLRFLSLVS